MQPAQAVFSLRGSQRLAVCSARRSQRRVFLQRTCRAASSSGVASSVRPRFVKNALADFCSTRRSARPTAERRCEGSSSWGHRRCVLHSS